jgi:beta-glucanase (GH16 family)
MQWQQTFNDDFASLDTTKWNGSYAGTLWCGGEVNVVPGGPGGCNQNYFGVSVANGVLSLAGAPNQADFTNTSNRAVINTSGKFTARVGSYWETRAKMPHDSTGEGDGLWPAIWELPNGKADQSGGGCCHEEDDLLEQVLSVTDTNVAHFTIHDAIVNEFSVQYPNVSVGDLSSAYHTYGRYWKNDGSPHGTMCLYFDGVQQNCHTLTAPDALWDNGTYLLLQVIPCPPGNGSFFNGGRCSNSTSANNPMLVDYTRVYQAVPAVTSAVRAGEFLNSMGVGTKIIQGDSVAATEAGFKYLGLRMGRDDATHNVAGAGSVASLCQIHADVGVMYDELPIVDDDPNNIADTKAEWEQLAACGAMIAGEGPNEPNNFGFSYLGQPCNGSTMVGCKGYMKDLYTMFHGDLAFAGMQLWGMTEPGSEQENAGLQFLSGNADVANAHNYVQGNGAAGISPADNQPRLAETIQPGLFDAYSEYWGPTWRMGFPGASTGQNDRPKVTTETGWNVFAHGSTVSRNTQGKLIIDLWFDAYQLGWAKTYVYEMFERLPNDAGYGFLNADGTPQPMGTYTHNLTTILADSSIAFTPSTIAYSVAGLPATGYSMLLQKSNGTYEMVVWGEAFASQVSTPITVILDKPYGTVNVYDPTLSAAPVTSLGNVSSVPLTLIDHPLIVEFK